MRATLVNLDDFTSVIPSLDERVILDERIILVLYYRVASLTEFRTLPKYFRSIVGVNLMQGSQL
jgi:hypothetical protein